MLLEITFANAFESPRLPHNFMESFGLLHNNPLNLDMVFMLVAIFVLVEVMEFFLSGYRHRNKLNYFPIVIALFCVSSLLMVYYCTINPQLFPKVSGAETGILAWFCLPRIVDWPLALFGMTALLHVVYCMLSVIHQLVYEISQKSGCSDNVWSVGVGLWLLVCVTWLVMVIFDIRSAFDIFVIISVAISLAYTVGVVVYMIAKGAKPLWIVLGSLFFFVTMFCLLPYSIDSLCVTYAIALLVLIIFGRARSYLVRRNAEKVESKNDGE